MESGNRIRRAWVGILCLLISVLMCSQAAWGQYDGGTGDPNWTNDLFEDDDENGYANDINGYDFA